MFTNLCRAAQKTMQFYIVLIMAFLLLLLASCGGTMSSSGDDGYAGTISYDGEEYFCKANIDGDKLILSVSETEKISKELKEECGIKGTLSVTQTKKTYLDIVSLKDGVLCAEIPTVKVYVSIKLSGTAVEQYEAYVCDTLKEALDTKEITQEEYDQKTALLGGEEILYDEDDIKIRLSFLLNDKKSKFLVGSIEEYDEDGAFDEGVYYEYINGILSKETGVSDDFKSVLEYYEDGVTRKVLDNYKINLESGSEILTSRKEYDRSGYATSLIIYDEHGRVIKQEIIDKNFRSKTTEYEYYEDGTLKSMTADEDGGYLRKTEYIKDGGRNEYLYYKDLLNGYYEYSADDVMLKEYYYGHHDNGAVSYEQLKDYECLKTGAGNVRVLISDITTNYDENGNVTDRKKYVYEYYENGGKKSEASYDKNEKIIENIKYYENGNEKYKEFHYGNGMWFKTEYYENGKAKMTLSFAIDGASKKSEWNERGDETLCINYDANGKVVSRQVLEYDENGNITRKINADKNGEKEEKNEYNESGYLKSHTCIERDAKGKVVSRSEHDYYADGKEKLIIYYDGNGNIHQRIEKEYHENGKMKLWLSYYGNGNYFQKVEYYVNGNCKIDIHYYENGNVKTKSECWEDGTVKLDYKADEDGYSELTEYNEKGDKISWILSAPNGIVIDSYRYEYEYYENGKIKSETSFCTADSRKESKKEYDENGNLKTSTIIERNGNGNVVEYHLIEYEYDENGNLKTCTIIERDGNANIVEYIHTKYEQYEDGRTKLETVYNENGDMVLTREYEYRENGMPKACIEYDKYGNEVKITYFDEMGHPIS